MRRLKWAGLVAVMGSLAVAGTANAVPPPNDNFANATLLQPLTSVAITGSNVDATNEIGENNCCFFHNSVWYRWTAPEPGTYRAELCASSFNTSLNVLTGAMLNTLTQVAQNYDDPGCGPDGTRSRLTFNAVQGQEYKLQIGSAVNGATGTISGSIARVPDTPTPPPPDTDPPETTIKRDVDLSRTGTVKFRFKSDEAGSTFECKLKGPDLKRKLRQFRACDSPRKYSNLDDGRFKFKVRAIDAAGNVDPTPDKDRFRVID